MNEENLLPIFCDNQINELTDEVEYHVLDIHIYDVVVLEKRFHQARTWSIMLP
jgi:hypothetical protein